MIPGGWSFPELQYWWFCVSVYYYSVPGSLLDTFPEIKSRSIQLTEQSLWELKLEISPPVHVHNTRTTFTCRWWSMTFLTIYPDNYEESGCWLGKGWNRNINYQQAGRQGRAINKYRWFRTNKILLAKLRIQLHWLTISLQFDYYCLVVLTLYLLY